MDPAASAALEQKYKSLWTQYKLTVTGLYFSDKPLSGSGEQRLALGQGRQQGRWWGRCASHPKTFFGWLAVMCWVRQYGQCHKARPAPASAQLVHRHHLHARWAVVQGRQSAAGGHVWPDVGRHAASAVGAMGLPSVVQGALWHDAGRRAASAVSGMGLPFVVQGACSRGRAATASRAASRTPSSPFCRRRASRRSSSRECCDPHARAPAWSTPPPFAAGTAGGVLRVVAGEPSRMAAAGGWAWECIGALGFGGRAARPRRWLCRGQLVFISLQTTYFSQGWLHW